MTGEQLPSPNPIAALNDEFRCNRPADTWLVTPGIRALPNLPGLVQAVRDFNNFNPDNDPWGEHNMGSIVWYQEKAWWKIKYYDQQLQDWCDPLSPECRRVLTLLLAEEYPTAR